MKIYQHKPQLIVSINFTLYFACFIFNATENVVNQISNHKEAHGYISLNRLQLKFGGI